VSAATMRARSDIRARPLSLMLVTLLVGLIGAVAIAALAASRRTDSAYTRYRTVANEPEALVLSCRNGFPAPRTRLSAVADLPEVTASAPALYTPVNVVDLLGEPLMYRSQDLSATLVGLSDPADAALLQPQLLAGRLPITADEVAVGWGQTGARRPAIGDRIEVQMMRRSALEAGGFPPPPNELLGYELSVTGEVLLPGELTGDQGSVWVSPAFIAAHSDQAWMCDVGAFQLRDDFTSTPSFLAGVYAIQPRALVLDMTAEAIYVSRTTHLDAIVLRLLAVLAGLAGVMVLGQSLVRRTSLGAIDTPILRALGMTKRQIVWAAALPALIVAVGGALLAATVAILASWLFPTGVTRIAEPDPGVQIDAFSIGLGVLVILLITVLSVVVPARVLASARGGVQGTIEYGGAARRSRIASAIAQLPLPVSAGAGARLALEPGHGRTATPVRSAIVGLTLAVAAMVAAFGFSASMDHFGATPRLWGLNFEFGTGQPFLGSEFEDKAVPVIRHDPSVANLAVGNFQHYVSLGGPNGRSQEAVWGLQTVKGQQVTLTMLEGRWPQAPGEIAAGRETLSAVGLAVGDTVTVEVAATSRDLTIVGVPVFPDFGFGPGLGRGVAMTMDELRNFYPHVTENLAIGDFTPGADPHAVLARLNSKVLRDLDAAAQLADLSPIGTTVQGTLRSRVLPLQLSALFASAAFATLVHVLLTSVRRRRRDLAILQTIGFRRRQVTSTIAWQALTLASIALVLGVPIGILLGRLGWAAFAYRLGVVSEPAVSPLSVIVVPITLLAGLVVSVGPGLVARRVRPAAVLKAE
jgi:ABC-type antimicrobial peptide transport system permease subunit